ncbi:MAG: ATP-binding protein, partial [Verrucomicrobiaceae bacterium]
FPVRAVADQAVEQEATEGADIRVEVDHDITVTADPELLARALGNLIRNAVRYAASQGPITITASNEPLGRTEITVSDSGPGVPEEDLTKIFDAFYRVDTSRTRDTGGVGLGLSIVKTCVEACGGRVVARNRKPQGLDVTVSLPAKRGTPA